VSVSLSKVHEHDTHDLLRTSSRGCHEYATRKTAVVEFKLITSSHRPTRLNTKKTQYICKETGPVIVLIVSPSEKKSLGGKTCRKWVLCGGSVVLHFSGEQQVDICRVVLSICLLLSCHWYSSMNSRSLILTVCLLVDNVVGPMYSARPTFWPTGFNIM